MSADGRHADAVLRVLVVDDDVVVPMLMAMGLDAVEVVEASRAAEALRLAREIRPDAVIVDRNLPDADGLDLVRSLRSEPTAADVPIVVVTAGFDEALRSTILRAGADDFVPKPIDPAALERALRQLVDLGPERLRERRERQARSLPLRAPHAADGTREPPGR